MSKNKFKKDKKKVEWPQQYGQFKLHFSRPNIICYLYNNNIDSIDFNSKAVIEIKKTRYDLEWAHISCDIFFPLNINKARLNLGNYSLCTVFRFKFDLRNEGKKLLDQCEEVINKIKDKDISIILGADNNIYRTSLCKK